MTAPETAKPPERLCEGYWRDRRDGSINDCEGAPLPGEDYCEDCLPAVEMDPDDQWNRRHES